jgi:uncharacterized protein YutE (UPF0331/DUF86 family)
MSDDVLLAKADLIERCVARARSELAASDDFVNDFTRQDAAVLNVQRACDAAIDMAQRLIRLRRLGLPASSREAFDLLASAGLIPEPLVVTMKNMVGFRNLSVHQYQKLDPAAVEAVIRHSLEDLLAFSVAAVRL